MVALMKNKKKIVTLLLLITIVFFMFPLTAFSAVNIVNITFTPPIVSKIPEIQVNMTISISLTKNQRIFIKFPDEFNIPQEIDPKNIRIGLLAFNPSVVYVEEKAVSIVLSQNLSKFEGLDLNGFPIIISPQAGIKNPLNPGNYVIQIWTDAERLPVEGSVYIGEEGEATGTQVDGLKVQLDDYFAGRNAEYRISFYNSNDAFMLWDNNDYIDIYFPKGTVLPANLDASRIYVNRGQSSKVEFNGKFLRIYLPQGWFINYGGNCEVVIDKEFGIINPEFTGVYVVQVATSKDRKLAISNQYTVIGTEIRNLNVKISPENQGAISDILVQFITSDNGFLKKDKGKIFLKLSSEFALPKELDPKSITVNGILASSISVANNIISIITPVDIQKNAQLDLIIKQEMGIVNPYVIGDYKILAATSSDAQFVGFMVGISPSEITEPQVFLSNNGAGQTSEYKIVFETGLGGTLEALVDKINITFPAGTEFPDEIKSSFVLLNDLPVVKVEVSGLVLTILVPTDVKEKSTVSITIKLEFGIVNPSVPNNCKLYVNTTKELKLVASKFYSIESVPVTSLNISPDTPDGLNGYYRSQPSISFNAQSAIDPNPTVYYYFEGNAPTIYPNKPIIAPEGIHTLYYYAIDKEGHKEETKSIQIKVDTIPPVINVITPANNAVLNSFTVIVKGVVDPGSTAKVNGESVQIDGMGNFETSVKLQNNPDVIKIFAVDIAGNSSQVSVSVSVDTTPPNLTILKPAMFQQVSKLPLVVEGITEKDAKVTVNGNSAEVRSDGTFSYPLQMLSEGQFTTIEVVVKDEAGNTTKKTVSVKYVKSIVMKLQIGNKSALINNETLALETVPVISGGRTMVPLRFVGEAFGAEFMYDSTFKIIDINFGSDKIKLQIGKKETFVNGNKVLLDIAPFIVNGRTLIPIRFISETFGSEVVWDALTKTVTIIYPKP